MMLIISKFLGLALRPRGTRLRTAKILKIKKNQKKFKPHDNYFFHFDF